MASKKQFKAESKRLLEMMINSIYTHKEIFLRELISNASDAMDKLYFKTITENNEVGMSRSDFEVKIALDKNARTIIITDNGIGMTKDELENNLGIIAKSGSLQFKQDNADAIKEKGEEDLTVIGQFGVGFYSAFMVASKVVVKTRAYGSSEAFEWKSEGVDGYTIEDSDYPVNGTEITLYIKENVTGEDGENEESYEDYLAEYKIKNLIKKYSDYIRYPIKMECTKSVPKEKSGDESDEAPEYVEVKEVETLNSMIPLWKKNKTELTDEDYNTFYKDKFHDYTDPIAHIHSKTEGNATYSALMFIPKKPPYDFYSKDYEKGLQLYSSGVMIMDKCSDLLPDYFSFVKGLVDSEDLSLNISREMLQHDRQLKLIERSIERSIKNELKKILNNDRDKYVEFWEAFGTQIKFGVYNGFGANKDTLKDLLMFYSSTEEKLTTLDEYVTRMKESQTQIFFASGESITRINSLPQVEAVKDKGFEILYLTENVDEFCLQMMMDYEGKTFKSVQSADLDIETEEEKDEIKKKNEDSKELFEIMKEALGDKISDIKLSQKLKTHPVCITSKGSMSVEMEKVLASMPQGGAAPKAEKVLEINANHPIYEKLGFLHDNDKDLLKIYAEILYEQALLIEGVSLENPAEFVNKISEIMTK